MKVVFRRAARAEFEGAAMWYEERQPGLGVLFAAEIDRAVGLAAKSPDRFPIPPSLLLRADLVID